MTQIILFLVEPFAQTIWLEDERDPREIVRLINRGRERAGKQMLPLDQDIQCASRLPNEDIVAVFSCEPPVHLTDKMYLALWALMDGQPYAVTAEQLGISESRLADLYDEIRCQFKAFSLLDVVRLADVYGLG